MKSKTKNEWAAKFALLFGFKADEDKRQLQLWVNEEMRGVSVQELDAATDLLAQKPDLPVARAKILQELLWAVREVNAKWAEEQREALWDGDRQAHCGTCRGSGWVTVPSVKCLQDGAWIPKSLTRSGRAHYYTCSVTCTCPRGRWRRDHSRNREDERCHTLDEYELLCPEWRQEMARVEEEQRAMLKLSGGPANRSFDEALDRLRALRDSMPDS